MDRHGYELPLLLAGAFRRIIDELHRRLAEQGHPDLRPAYGFALQAIGRDGATVSELGRRLGVSKQAATKTLGKLTDLGYVTRGQDPTDARAVLITLTPHGRASLTAAARIFEDLHREWRESLGPTRLQALEDDLPKLTPSNTPTPLADLPGWFH
ncbi:transcriptional regulator, MarR family [Kribbella flavida DSM 17836]|uniref:Transcriptional regulator, MarR family n=1 Tax=Kribbella flavida (strain DSM 17836 / JCM 10339 / NBRC 14399) TaxID=479435 RepID=D2PX80_KRIFD|nr:MarR family transcriptional regulator [Kribbella flavida]ADB29728.1 transcriptional regulator, MarR family [Kribbella flavida DSM 17836]